jgi:hypothetical protein
MTLNGGRVKKLNVLAAGAVGAMVVWLPMFGAGVAAADDYAGQTYADVSSALSQAKLKGVIATRMGDASSNDKCIVTHSEKAPWIKGDKFGAVTDTVLLYLNCNATVASATTPGNSAASPEGRAALVAANSAAAQGQSTAAAAASQPKH